MKPQTPPAVDLAFVEGVADTFVRDHETLHDGDRDEVRDALRNTSGLGDPEAEESVTEVDPVRSVDFARFDALEAAIDAFDELAPDLSGADAERPELITELSPAPKRRRGGRR